MKKLFVVASALTLFATLSMSSHAATVITFDDLTPDHNANFGPNFAIPPANYHGLNWVNTIIEPQSSYIPGSLNLNVSVPNVATDVNYLGYNTNAAPIQFSSSTPFTFNSAYFIANQVQNLQVTVEGLSNGIIADTSSFIVGTTTPVLGQFNWSNIDTVIMSSSGGIGSGHKSFSFDNLVISPGATVVPVPAAAWLFGSGLIGLVGVARKRKAAYYS